MVLGLESEKTLCGSRMESMIQQSEDTLNGSVMKVSGYRLLRREIVCRIPGALNAALNFLQQARVGKPERSQQQSSNLYSTTTNPNMHPVNWTQLPLMLALNRKMAGSSGTIMMSRHLPWILAPFNTDTNGGFLYDRFAPKVSLSFLSQYGVGSFIWNLFLFSPIGPVVMGHITRRQGIPILKLILAATCGVSNA